MKYYFYVEGEKKEDLDVIRKLIHDSKKFNDAPSGMAASFVLEGENPDYEIRQLKDKLHRRNMIITDLRRHLEEAERHIRDLKKTKRIEADYIEKLLHEWQATEVMSFDCNAGRRDLALYLAEILNR